MSEHELARWLYQGALALSEGRRDEAQRLLLQVIEQDDQNEQAWLWLSGAVDDPADQQVALENVLAINPRNAAAHAGLTWLLEHAQPAGSPVAPAPLVDPEGPWVPPPPYDENDVVEIMCWQCQATLYSVAPFCWQCHTPVHSCNNCVFRDDMRCKPLQGLTSTLAQTAINECPWWRPVQR
ncbi:MAG: tetratricopeptide repeat protein [Chloroflexi bacterium]|nr:tetratricopeptide repeat protein [Chloroflexota bacterium]